MADQVSGFDTKGEASASPSEFTAPQLSLPKAAARCAELAISSQQTRLRELVP
jgi:hypothetical protein